MSYSDPAAIAQALAHSKRANVPWSLAWARAGGKVPADANRKDGGVDFFLYSAMKLAYHNGGKPCGLTRDSASDPEFTGSPRRGASRPSKLVA